MALAIEISKGEIGVYRVKLSGSLDTETAGKLNAGVEEVLADVRARVLRLELHGLTYISSVGLGSLAKMRSAMAARGGVMVTVGAQPQIARVFEIVKMLPKETVFVSHKEADEYLAAIQKEVIEERRDVPPEGGKNP